MLVLENSYIIDINRLTCNIGTYNVIRKIREFFSKYHYIKSKCQKPLTKDSLSANILKQSVAIYLTSILVIQIVKVFSQIN